MQNTAVYQLQSYHLLLFLLWPAVYLALADFGVNVTMCSRWSLTIPGDRLVHTIRLESQELSV